MSVWKGGLWRSQFGGGGDSGGGGSNQPAGYRRYLTFDRVDDCVDVSGAAASISGLEQFTVEAVVWVDDYFSNASEHGEIFAAFEQGEGVPSIQFRQNDVDGTLLFGYSPQSLSFTTTFSENSVARERWAHVAGTLDVAAGEMSLYFDGELVATDASGGTGIQTLQQAAIGNRLSKGDRFFKGKMARVSLWQRALSAAEIADLAAAPPGASDSDLLHYWELDTGTNSIPDLAGNAGGTVLGGAQWEPEIPGYA